LPERQDAARRFRIVGRTRHKHAHPPYAPSLLRPRCDRPSSRASQPCDELPPFHSITSSARLSNEVGTASPSALASDLMKDIRNVGSVAHQPADFDERTL
jgi:hypothetical protein